MIAALLEAIKKLPAMRKVTQEEALHALEEILDELPDLLPDAATAMLVEIVGFAATCDDPELLRRFIVLQNEHGPLVPFKGENEGRS